MEAADQSPETSPGPNRPRPPLGLQLIAGLHVVVALLLLYVTTLLSGILVPVLAVAAVGIAWLGYGLWSVRELARKILVGLCAVGLAGNALVAGWLIAMLLGWLDTPPNVHPIDRLLRLAVNSALTWWLMSYMRSEAVRTLFATHRHHS